jgi:anaerobic selenocysteine-containing dehydrogenase
MMNDPDRLTTSMTRTDPRAGHTPIAVDDAISQIAEKIRHVIDCHGPDSVAMFIGTQHHFATLTDPMARAWFKATGSHKLFSTMTIDQSAKWVTAKRMGEYTGGRQRLFVIGRVADGRHQSPRLGERRKR